MVRYFQLKQILLRLPFLTLCSSPSERQTRLVMPIFGGGVAVRGEDADVEAEEEREAKETWLCWLCWHWLWL